MAETVKIRPLSLNECDLEPLLLEARSEGFAFVDRLIDEWAAGSNQFDRNGEKLFGAFLSDQIVAFGGLNRDPYANDQTGRLRHLFVSSKHRRLGIGHRLVSALLADAGNYFSRVRLYTTSDQAAIFYLNLGFTAVGDNDATHEVDLTSSNMV